VPTILVHGGADTTILPQNSIDLNDALIKAGITSELQIIPGANHSCIGKEVTISEWIAAFFAKEWSKANANVNSFIYRVVANNSTGNSYSNEASIVYSSTLETQNFTNKNDVIFYPNPTDSGNITVNLKGYHLMNTFYVVINSLEGQQLFSKKYQPTNTITIELNAKLSKGIYLISFRSEKTSFTKKLIVN
jgi:hypothetical protein